MAKKVSSKKKTNKEGESRRNKLTSKFPSISRFIPEKINESYIFIVALLFILISAAVISFDLYRNIALEKKLVGETSELQGKLYFWEKEIQKHPDYRDAYFNLALINYQLKDFSSSRTNLEKALNIDPNFEKGRRLQEILSRDF